MIMEIKTIVKFICSICQKEYSNEDEAKQCCNFPKTITVYAHGGKLWNEIEELGLNSDSNLLYAVTEVSLKLEVNIDGTYSILKVDNLKVLNKAFEKQIQEHIIEGLITDGSHHKQECLYNLLELISGTEFVKEVKKSI